MVVPLCRDLRTFKESGFVAEFKYHNSHITSVEWSRFDSTTLATASADNQVRQSIAVTRRDRAALRNHTTPFRRVL